MVQRCIISLLVVLFSFSLAFCESLDKWHIAKSTHFVVHYKNAPEDFINKLIDKSEDYYDKIAEDLGFRRYNFWLWDNRAKIYIYDDVQDYQRGTGQPGWSSGCAMVKDKVIYTFAYAHGFFDTILVHEMGHIIFREFVGFDNPAVVLWLDEGVASYQERSRYLISGKVMKEAEDAGRFMDIEKLTRFNLQSSQDTEMVNLYYMESTSIITYLIKEFGKDTFVLFCQSLRDKKDLTKALSYAYSFKNIQDLDKSWQEYLFGNR